MLTITFANTACCKVYLYVLSYLIPFTLEPQGDILFIVILHGFINLLAIGFSDNLGQILQMFFILALFF